jgi:hypothetical protein
MVFTDDCFSKADSGNFQKVNLLLTSNPEFLAAAPEGGLIDAKYICGLLKRFCHSQHSPDMFLLDLLQRNPIAKSCARITRQQIFRQTFDTDTVGLTENGSPFNNISQLSEVSRPLVLSEGLKLPGVKPRKYKPGQKATPSASGYVFGPFTHEIRSELH